MSREERMIVAEISKNWPGQLNEPLCVLFDRCIEANRKRGYKLHSWRFNQITLPGEFTNRMVETIIAVFEKVSDHKSDTTILEESDTTIPGEVIPE